MRPMHPRIKGFLEGLAGALIFGTAMVYGSAEAADSTFVAGFGGGNGACGDFEPRAFVEYDRDDAARPIHVNVSVAPNGSCTGQGIVIDASAEQRFDVSDTIYAVVAAGYDRRTVPFEYEGCPDGFKCFHSAAVETASVAAGAGLRLSFGTVSLTYNAVRNPLQEGGDLSPVSVTGSFRLLDSELDVTVRAEGIWDARVTRQFGKVQFGASIVNNAHLMEHAAPAEKSGLDRAGGPNPLYGFDFGVRF